MLRPRSSGRRFLSPYPACLHHGADHRLSPLKRKKALRCVKRISNANIFEAAISRKAAQRRRLTNCWHCLRAVSKLVMAHLVETGEITLEDVKEAEKSLRKSQ